MSRISILTIVTVSLMAAFQASAELRDPTRPSGYYQELPVSDADMAMSDELKLQAIFYTPGNPAVLINGRRYAVDDLVGDSRVLAIKADSVILTGLDGEKELKLTVPLVKTRHGDKPAKPAQGMK